MHPYVRLNATDGALESLQITPLSAISPAAAPARPAAAGTLKGRLDRLPMDLPLFINHTLAPPQGLVNAAGDLFPPTLDKRAPAPLTSESGVLAFSLLVSQYLEPANDLALKPPTDLLVRPAGEELSDEAVLVPGTSAEVVSVNTDPIHKRRFVAQPVVPITPVKTGAASDPHDRLDAGQDAALSWFQVRTNPVFRPSIAATDHGPVALQGQPGAAANVASRRLQMSAQSPETANADSVGTVVELTVTNVSAEAVLLGDSPPQVRPAIDTEAHLTSRPGPMQPDSIHHHPFSSSYVQTVPSRSDVLLDARPRARSISSDLSQHNQAVATYSPSPTVAGQTAPPMGEMAQPIVGTSVSPPGRDDASASTELDGPSEKNSARITKQLESPPPIPISAVPMKSAARQKIEIPPPASRAQRTSAAQGKTTLPQVSGDDIRVSFEQNKRVLSFDTPHHPGADPGHGTDPASLSISTQVDVEYGLSNTGINPEPVAGQQPSLAVTPQDLIRQIIEPLGSEVADMQVHDRRQLRLHLRPPQLGEMMIQLEESTAGLIARIEVSTHAAKQLLEANLPDLFQALNDSGVNLQDFQLSHDTHEGGGLAEDGRGFSEEPDRQSGERPFESRENKVSHGLDVWV